MFHGIYLLGIPIWDILSHGFSDGDSCGHGCDRGSDSGFGGCDSGSDGCDCSSNSGCGVVTVVVRAVASVYLPTEIYPETKHNFNF